MRWKLSTEQIKRNWEVEADPFEEARSEAVRKHADKIKRAKAVGKA